MSDVQLVALVEDIRDGSCAAETDAVEWKSTLDFTKADSRFALPKNVLGMANRLPAIARRDFGGFGYILVGVEAGSIPGVPPVDAAQIHDWIDPYVGATGPVWQPRFVTVDTKTILVIEVEPPRPGDRIQALRKECANSLKGTVFVRKNGKTHQADDQDIANLEQRSKGARLELDLQPIGPPQMTWFDRSLIEREIAQVAADSRHQQIRRAQPRSGRSDPSNTLEILDRLAEKAFFGEETRSMESYVSQVEEWHSKWGEIAPRHWVENYMLAGHGVYSLQLDNLTEENFGDVELRLRIERAWVNDEVPSEAVELPAKPKPFGMSGGLSSLANINLDFPILGAGVHSPYDLPTIFATNHEGGAEVVWKVGHLRPEEAISSDAIAILVDTQQESSHLTIQWQATSTSVNGVLRGELEIPLAERQIDLHDIEHDLGS
ncbi:helix-turn-helix domain-containing protein [Candidatus Poriferisodalis sp.]|uniref:AlbA family DNA-binding domain-containing protein n=1 Tax=Candidatus Poriferisodalis sp. TaxID=3101277 RepID=UPI003B527231